MWHAWERTGNFSFWWESLKERDHSEDRGVDGIRLDRREIGYGCRVD
jgi:hypothetical protein